MYDWHLLPTENDVGWDLPRFCKAEVFEELPLLFQANDVQYDNFQGNREKVLFNTLAEHMSSNNKSVAINFIVFFHFDSYSM